MALFFGSGQRSSAQLPEYIPVAPVAGVPLRPAEPPPVYFPGRVTPGATATGFPPPGGFVTGFGQPAATPPVATPPSATPPVAAPPVGIPATGATVSPGTGIGTGLDPMGLPATAGTQNPPAAPADPGAQWGMNWNNGLYFQTANKNFTFHAGGTVQYDFSWYSASPILELGPGGTGKFNDGANLRRGRLFMEGTFWQAVDYKFELEFFNGIGFSPAGTQSGVVAGSVTNSPGPTDAWITVKDVPFFGNVRIGSQKEWFSLEHLNVYRYLEFMERSYLFDFAQPTAFNNGFTPGISTFRTWLNDRVFTAIGAYKNESDLIGFGLGDGNYAVTGRVAALPVWMPEDQIFWHVGGAMSHRDPVNGQVQIRIRDNIRNAPFPLLPLVANTGLINASSQNLFNLETAAVAGPLTLQAEYTANVLNNASVGTGPNMGDLYFGAYYAEALLFLTGESRTWNVKNAFFNRVQPLRPLRLKPTDCDGYGFGAWELGVRYTYVDLSNKSVQAGRLDAVTLGLNWYLNANAKLQFNYDYTHRGDTNNPAQGHISAFGTRMQFDF